MLAIQQTIINTLTEVGCLALLLVIAKLVGFAAAFDTFEFVNSLDDVFVDVIEDVLLNVVSGVYYANFIINS